MYCADSYLFQKLSLISQARAMQLWYQAIRICSRMYFSSHRESDGKQEYRQFFVLGRPWATAAEPTSWLCHPELHDNRGLQDPELHDDRGLQGPELHDNRGFQEPGYMITGELWDHLSLAFYWPVNIRRQTINHGRFYNQIIELKIFVLVLWNLSCLSFPLNLCITHSFRKL